MKFILDSKIHLVTSSPELSQRLFGITSSSSNNSAATPTNTNNSIVTSNASMISLVAPTPRAQQTSSASSSLQAIEFNDNINVHLPTILGLKLKNTGQQQELQNPTSQSQQNNTMAITSSSQSTATSTNPNSLLKQQLRAGLKDLIDVTLANNNNTNNQQATSSNDLVSSTHMDTQEACSALQSLANAAERQAAQNNSIQPPSANNLHHQFLLHMAANPIMKSGGDFFQQHQNALLLREDENNIDLLMDQSDKSDPEMLTLADENAGLDYSTGNEGMGGAQGENNENMDSSYNNSMNQSTMSGHHHSSTPRSKNSNGKPIQRRRVRRKAQSSIDDQAEQLTEMSVRGLDLFRYASVTEGVYQCTECAKENMQKTFKNKYSFQRHAFLYHEGKHRKVFPCPLCGKEFSRPDKMKNHMKMTHASFMAKEIQNFNPLNYLISAAAADEIQPTNFGNVNGNPSSAAASQPLISQLQSSNPALSIMINNNGGGDNNTEECFQNTTQQQHQQQEKENLQQELKLPTDIEIKNEIVISPSPSPPPPPASSSSSSRMVHQLPTGTSVSLAETSSLSLLKSAATNATTNAQLNAQRIEEVK